LITQTALLGLSLHWVDSDFEFSIYITMHAAVVMLLE